ncbi:MAG: dihydroorotase [Verrucomicrobiota bacterium]
MSEINPPFFNRRPPASPPGPVCLSNGRVIDPAGGRDEIADVYLRDGKVEAVLPADATESGKGRCPTVIDCEGKIVAPGLVDCHVHFREPGGGQKESIATGTRAAAAGGFTSVLMMPNTSPPADGPNTIAWMRQRAEEKAVVNVYTSGCISAGMEGEVLAPIGSLRKSGVVAITDDGLCVQNNELMRRACEYATMFDLPILDHCQDAHLTTGGVMNEGYWSTVLGLPGWPTVAEEIIVARNALLAETSGASLHCQHLSSVGAVRIIREARARGVDITGEVMPHHLALTDQACDGYDTNAKMNPPLRTQREIDALLEGIADGTITILSSDHAPHADYEKEVEFRNAPFGIIGLETELAVFIKTLIEPKVIDWPKLIEMLTIAPAKLMRCRKGTLAEGAAADVTVIDPDLEWTVMSELFESKSRNCPFDGWELKGRATHTIVGGEIVWTLDGGFGE